MTTSSAGIGRVTAAIVAIAAMLPYLTIKILWLTGNPVGVSAPDFLDDPSMVGLNAVTFAMDLVGLLLALAFTMRWGMRLPAWLVLLPIWVGTGLLSQIVAVLPFSVAMGGTGVFPEGGPLAQWVYLAVYAGFVGQGIGLMVAFALYARDRWPSVFTTPLSYRFASATRLFQRVVAWGALLVVLPVGGIKLYWAFGGEIGLHEQVVAAFSGAAALRAGVEGLLAWLGAAGLLAVVLRRPRLPFWTALAAGWLGAGAMFGWGLYAMVLTVLKPPLTAGVTFGTQVMDALELVSLLAGLVIGLAGAFLLAERSDGGDGVQPAQDALEGEQRHDDRQPADRGHR